MGCAVCGSSEGLGRPMNFDRSGLVKVRKAAEDGRIDIFLIKNHRCLGNDLLKTAGFLRELGQLGIFESAAYVDGLEKKLYQVATELNNVRKQLVDLQEQQMLKSIKVELANAAECMKALCNNMKEKLFEVKTEFKEKAASIVTEVKAKGKEALNRVTEYLGIREKLEKIRINAKDAGLEVDKTINKIDCFSADIREARRIVINALRTYTEKERVDYSKEETAFSNMEIIKKPWEWKKMFIGMVLRLDAAIDKLDSLAKDVVINKMEKIISDKVKGEAISMVAEKNEYQYISEVYAEFQKQNVNIDVGEQRVDTAIKNDFMKRYTRE